MAVSNKITLVPLNMINERQIYLQGQVNEIC